MENFKLSTKDFCGSHLLSNLTGIKFDEICEILGAPNELGDDYKVPFMWVIENDNGDVLTLYPWKNTRLYSDDLPSVDEMKKSNTLWNIGGVKHLVAQDFINFINKKRGF